MTITPEALAKLSEAATQGEWEVETDYHDQPFPGIVYPGSPFEFADFSVGENSNENQANAELCAALVNLYRTNRLVLVDDGAVERVARAISLARMKRQMPELAEHMTDNITTTYYDTEDATAALAALKVKP